MGVTTDTNALPVVPTVEVTTVLNDLLDVNSLVNCSYKNQQLLENAINQCTYQEQNLNWYEEVDINSVKIKSFYDVCASDADVYNDDDEYGEFIPSEDDDTIVTDNITNTNKLEDPYEYQLYDKLRAQIDGGAKVSVTNNLDLLHDIRFYDK